MGSDYDSSGTFHGLAKRWDAPLPPPPGTMLCAGCKKPLGARYDPPMRNMGAFGMIHNHPDCARKATAKHYEAEKSDDLEE